MEWSSKKKQEVESLVKKITNNASVLAIDALKIPFENDEIKKQHEEFVMEMLTDTLATVNCLQDYIILLGHAYQTQRESILKTTIAMVDKIGEDDKPEPVKPVKPKPDPRIFVWGAVISLLLGYLIPSLVWWNWNNWQPEMMITGYISFMATFAVFFMWGLSRRINQVADWEMKNSSGGHP